MSKILFVSSEAYPLIKTGGLADVSGSLPAALKSLNQAVRLILPAYPAAKQAIGKLKRLANFHIPSLGEDVSVLEGRLPGSQVITWLVDCPPAFERPGNPYLGPDGKDWPDNAQRFAIFAHAVTAVALDQAGLNWQPEIVHCNDWQSGLVPALLSMEAQRPTTIFTIHNLAYQGLFPAETFQQLALPHVLWSLHNLEFHGMLSFIKGGLTCADRLTTVSPSYAREIQTPEFGCGLDGLLKHRSDVLTGILNGIDTQEWDPASDPHLARHYSATNLAGKKANKRALQAAMGLPESDSLLLGSVGRLVEQKGVDLILGSIDHLAQKGIQLAMLGSGEAYFEQALLEAAKRYPDNISVQIGYNEKIAHQIEAGADAFLMPSRFEPCGLNQLYSLRYGTLPIVHAVGGLADTVTDCEHQALHQGRATGFCFTHPNTDALKHNIDRAAALFAQPRQWHAVMHTAMQQDFDWRNSARQYLSLYQQAVEERL